MISHKRIGRGHIEEETAILPGKTREPIPVFSFHHSPVERSAVIVADGIDDLTRLGGESEASLRDVEDSLDLRDLLLDEAD